MNNIQLSSYPSKFTCNLSKLNFNSYLKVKGDYNFLSNAPWIYNSSNNSIITYSNIGIGKLNPTYSLDIANTINCQKLFINDSNIIDFYNSNLNLDIYNIQTNGLLSNNYYFYSNDGFINFPKATTASILLVGAGGRGGGFIVNDSNIIRDNTSNLAIIKNSKYQINSETIININDANYNVIFNNGAIILNDISNDKYKILANLNPIAWYKFDNPLNLGLDTQGTFNLTNNNSVSNTINAIFGNYSASFNGTNQYLSIANNFGLNNIDFTISFWVYRFNNNRQESILQFGSVSSLAQRLIIFYTSQNYMNFGLFGKENQTIAYPNDANNWVHWVFSYNYNNRTIQIYRNGSSVYMDTTINNQINFDNTFYIGTNNQAGISNFNGLIDDLRIYNKELVASQVQELYNIYPTYIQKNKNYLLIKNNNPIAWYKFDNPLNLGLDTQGTFNLTNNNLTSTSLNSLVGDYSCFLNGSQYLSIANNFGLNNIDFTISFWVYRFNNNRNESILQFGSVSSLAQRLIILYTTENYMKFGLYGKENQTIAYPNDANNWVHWVFSYNNSNRTIQIYRNGLSVYMDTTINNPINFDNTFYIGTNNQAGISNFIGLIDDLRIYKRNLWDYEIQGLYANINNNTTIINQNTYSTYFITKDNSYPILKDLNDSIINPLVWYKFENSNNMLIDSSGNNYNLINNGATFDSNNYIKANGSIYFNTTTNTYISLIKTPNFYNIQTLNGISISFWFKITNQTANYANFFVFNATNNVNNSGSFYVKTDGTNLAFGLWDNDWFQHITSGIIFNNNTWFNIIWTISNTGIWKIYSNSQDLNVGIVRNFNSTASFGSAIRNIGSQIIGNIDDFRIYDFELSAAQVQELYRGKITIISPIYNNFGGGSAGDIIYYPNYNFNKGNYNIKIGKDSSLPILRDSYIYDSNFNGLIAKGGDDGEPTYNNIDISTVSIYNKTFKFGTYYNINNTGYKYIAAGTYDFIFNQGGLTINNVFNRSYPDITDTNNNIIKPVLWYKFNNSSNFLNEEYYSSNNIWNSNCSFDTTNYIKGSGSLAFNAQLSQFVKIPNNINLNSINTTTGISFSVWVRFSTRVYSWSRIFDFGMPNPANGTNGYSYIFMGIYSNTGGLRFAISNNGSETVHDNTIFNYRDGIWRHYVWTISTTGVWNIYINGESFLSNSAKIVIPTFTLAWQSYYLGKAMFQDDYLDGNIDDFRIYNRVLTQADVNKLYKGECKIIKFISNTNQITTTLTDTYITNDFVILRDNNNKVINPIRWYKFNINGMLDDSSGNNITGSLNGTNASTIITLDTTNFIKGNASLNNTSVNYCYFKFALTKQPPITFCYWIRFNSFSNWCVFSYNNDANTSSLQMDIIASSTTTGYFYIYMAIPSIWNVQLSGASYQLFTNKWYFVSMTFGIKSTGTVVKLYINGILIATSTGSVNAEFPTIGTVYLGKSGENNRGFDGKFNDVRVYDFELSGTQINYLYNGNNYKIDSNTLIKFNNENENYILKDNYNIYSSNGNFAIGSYISKIDNSYPILNITPILWYKFENSTNFENDYLNNPFNKLYNSLCSFHTSDFIKGDGSLYFNSAINAHIRIPNVIDFNAINKNKGITFSFWAKLNSSTPNWGRILFFCQSYISNPFISANHIQIAREGTSGNLYFKIGRAPLNTDYGTFGSSYSFNEIYLRNFNYFDGVWRHFIWSISPSGEWSIYVNGILVYNINNYIIIPYFNPLYQYNFIGKSIEQNNHPFNGYLDDFRIYDEVLSLNQIIELYNGNIKILNTNAKNNSGKFINDFNYNYSFTSNTSNFNIPFQSYVAINNDDIIPITSNSYTINFNKGVTTINNINLTSTYHILKNDDLISLNPLVWYKFENSSNMLIDSSGNNYNLVNNGATFDSNNYIKANGSINLNLNKYVITENNINFYTIQKNRGITFSFWGKFSSSTPFSAYILSIPNSYSDTAYVYIARNASTQNLEFNINNESVTANFLILNVPSISFFNDIWFHLVWSISPIGEWSISINGIKQIISKTVSFNSTGDHNTKMTLGWAHTASVYYAIGNIDDFRIYDFVLNTNQVQELYNNGVNIYTNSKYPVLKNYDLISLNPLVWYKFDTSNNLGFDSSSNKIHLSNVGSVLTSNDIIKGESSILFNGTNYLNYNSNFTYNNGIVSYNSNYTYLIYTNDGTITFNQDSICDLIVVGAGGRSGGNPNINMTFTTNSSNITINKQAIYNINYGEFSNLPIGTYNYSFNNGIINIEKQIDNNYPILRYSSNNSEIIPTAWYKFDDPTNLGKDTIGNYNLINNNATFNTNNYVKGTGSCSILRANSQYLTLNNLDFTNLSFTISLWSYLISYESSGETPLFAKGDNISTTSQALFCQYQETNIQFGFYDDNTLGGNFPNDTNIWIYWVFTYNKDTKKRKIYRNGNLIAEDNALSAGYIPSTHNYRIGGFYLNNSQKYFNGYIDDFRIYDIELSATQILKLYNDSESFYNITDKSYPIVRNSNNFEILPLVWYKFDNSTNIGLDSMNKHNLTNNGATTYSTADFIKGSGCASFNGTSQFLSKTSAFNLNSKDFTISCWIKRNDNNPYKGIFQFGEGTAINTYIGLYYDSNNKINITFRGDDIATTLTLNDAGIWIHYVITFKVSTKNRKLYRNGIEIINNISAGIPITATNTIKIGTIVSSYNYYFNGLIDDFRVYETELTAAQVQELYNGRVNIYYPNLNDIGGSSGGGGQVINYPNYKFNTGTYNFNIGIDSDNSNNRITKIKNNNYNDLITSIGGGDGGVFAIERRYPPKTYDAISSSLPVQTIFNNCNCYRTDLYINPLNVSYGSGTYEIYFSSINSTTINERNPALLFDNIYSPSTIVGSHFGNNYSTLANGNFLYTSNLVEPTYYGDWILIKLPIPIILKSYTFYGREEQLTRVPKTYKIYGSTNGINWVTLDNTSNLDLNYYQNNSLNYTKYLHTNINKYQYYCLTVNQIMSNGTILNFLEWELKGIEELSSIKTLNGSNGNYNLTSNQRRYPPKPYTTTTLSTTEMNRTLNGLSVYGANITLDTTNITYGSGTYEINYNGIGYADITTYQSSPLNLFDFRNDKAAVFRFNSYDINTGNFIGNIGNLNEYLFDNSFKGCWISIKLPKPIILTSYEIYPRLNYINRCPKKFKVYGSNSGINSFTTLDSVNLSSSSVYNPYYNKIISNNTSYFDNYCFTVNQIFAGESVLVINEIGLYGVEDLDLSFISNNLISDTSKIETITGNNLMFGNNGSLTPVKNFIVDKEFFITGNYITSNINSNNFYVMFLNGYNNSLKIPNNCIVDILVVGAGGRGGIGPYSGGGGAGEVVYYPNLSLLTGTYNIDVGIDSSNTTDRISKLRLGATEIISAKGGGDGGYWDGSSIETIEKQFPSKAYNSLTARTTSTLNEKSCQYQTIFLNTIGITNGAGTYEIYWSSYIGNENNNGYWIFNFITSGSSVDFACLNGNYTATTGALTTQGQNYWLVESTYKGDWFAIKLPIPIALTKYTLVSRATYDSRAPKNFRIYGSMNGTNWTTIQTVTDATYTARLYDNTALSANTTPYLYYAMVVNAIVGGSTNSTILQVAEWYLYGKQALLTLPSSGGSGGGGYGNPNQSQIIQSGASAGIPFDNNYSKLTNGFNGSSTNGGDGGSATAQGRFESVIKGALSYYGLGGSGATSNSLPSAKVYYGDGGDGNSGSGASGIVIVKFNFNDFAIPVISKIFNNNTINSLIVKEPDIVGTYITSKLNSSNFYVMFTSNFNNSINIPYNCKVDALVVGAGGRGGVGAYSGGGGAGEIVYYPNLNLLSGIYTIDVGSDNSNFLNRISKLRLGSTEIIKANGGGDGGFNISFNSNQTGIIINQYSYYKFNEEPSIILNPSTYDISFSTPGAIILTDTVNSKIIIDKSYPVLRDTTSGAIINPTAWYKFDNTTNLGLDTQNSYNLALTNAPTSTTGIKGTNAVVFNGTTNYISTTNGVNLNSKSFSICCWAYATTLDANNRYIYGYNGSVSGTAHRGRGLQFGFRSSTVFTFDFWYDTLNYTTSGDLNTWNFWCATFDIDTKTQYLYKNGSFLLSRITTGTTGIIAPSQSYNMGRAVNSTGYFAGRIDDFRIYTNKVLSLDEIQEIYKGRLTFFKDNTSGGSGGGGGGGDILNIYNQAGASAGTPFNITYSKLTNGDIGTSVAGGNGGSATAQGRFESVIKGALSYYGGGGIGATSNSLPITKTYYGDGGDGNGGSGASGIVILKFDINDFIIPLISKKFGYGGNGYGDIGTNGLIIIKTPFSNPNYFIPINFTISLWIKLTYNADIKTVFSAKSNKMFNNSGYEININNSNLEFSSSTSNYLIKSNFISTITSIWQHLVFTYNDSNKLLKCFIDSIDTNLSGFSIDSLKRFITDNFAIRIGNNLPNGTLIDDFRIYDFVLNANQIQELYNGKVNIYYNNLGKSKGNNATSISNTQFNLTLGEAGIGGTSNSFPSIKMNYGSGGDGNNGSAGNGLMIIKINETIEEPKEFKGYIDWNNVTNIYNTTSNNFIGVNQNKAFKLNYDSNVFTLDPFNKLTIPNLISSNSDIIYTGTAKLTNNIYNISNLFSNVPVKLINNNIAVGIGITNPQSKLHLGYVGYSNSDILIKLTDNITGHTVDNGMTLEKDNTGAGILWNHQNMNIQFNTNNTEVMRISSNGNIGIGITNPTSAIEINNFITTKRFDYRRSATAAPTTAGNFAICYSTLLFNNNLSPSIITYTVNSAIGDSFTINKKGMYSINAMIGNNYSGGSLFWIDKNEASTNTYTANTNVPNILVMTSTGNYNHSSVIYTGLLNVNDVIRIKSTFIANLVTSVNHTLTITLLSGII